MGYSLQDKRFKLQDHYSMRNAENLQVPYSAWETDFKRNNFPSNGIIPQLSYKKDVKTQVVKGWFIRNSKEVSDSNVQVQASNLEYHPDIQNSEKNTS
jgi:hypothetical protein